MSKSRSDSSSFAKIVVVLAIAFGVGLGLCGMSFLFPMRGNEEFGTGPVGDVSAWIMILSVFGLVVTLIVWMIAAISGSRLSGDDGPQRLFENKDDEQEPR